MSDQPAQYGHHVLLYGPAIQEAARSGDVSRMREIEKQAEKHLHEVTGALEELRSALRKHHG